MSSNCVVKLSGNGQPYTSEEERLEIAETILSEMGGRDRLCVTIGMYDLISSTGSPVGIQFSFRGSRKANKCRVTYLPDFDLYKFELFRHTPVRYAHCPRIFEAEQVHFTQFVYLFENNTGLFI